MELVEWIIPQDGGALAVAWVPRGVDVANLPQSERPCTRRSALVESRWLSHPIALATFTPFVAPLPLSGAVLSLACRLVADAPHAPPLVSEDAQGPEVASLCAEIVQVAADLAEAASLPPRAIALFGGGRVGFSLAKAASPEESVAAVLLWGAALDQCARVRGLRVDALTLSADDGPRAVDATLWLGRDIEARR